MSSFFIYFFSCYCVNFQEVLPDDDYNNNGIIKTNDVSVESLNPSDTTSCILSLRSENDTNPRIRKVRHRKNRTNECARRMVTNEPELFFNSRMAISRTETKIYMSYTHALSAILISMGFLVALKYILKAFDII